MKSEDLIRKMQIRIRKMMCVMKIGINEVITDSIFISVLPDLTSIVNR